MLFHTLLLNLFLALEVFSQELREEDIRQTTELPSITQEVDWDYTNEQQFLNNVPQARANNQHQPFFNSPYGPIFLPVRGQPIFGARLQQENVTFPTPRYYSNFQDPLEMYYVNLTDGSNLYPESSHIFRYPFNNGMLSQPPVSYYPQAFSSVSAEDTAYPLPPDPNVNVYNPIWQDITGKLNESEPEYTPRLQEDQVHLPIGNQPNSNVLQRRDSNWRWSENSVPLAPYSYPASFLASSVRNNDEVRGIYPDENVFVRTPYVDRESGTDTQESSSIKEQSNTSLDRNFPAVPEPSEAVPPKFVPRRLYPVNVFPYGIPQPNLVPPFPLPQGLIPPTNPPIILPNAPIPSINPDENLLSNELNQPPVTLPENVVPKPLPEVPLPSEEPKEVLPIEPTEINGKPYEFGFDMNDGQGTDQHRKEFADGSGTVTGSYGYRDAFGVYRIVNYIADKSGFRAFIRSNEPGVANPGSADVTVVSELPPPKTIEDSFKTLKLDSVDIPDEPSQKVSSLK